MQYNLHVTKIINLSKFEHISPLNHLSYTLHIIFFDSSVAWA